ncbi:MAG: hypothetical protein KI792_01805 [Alphaproteobacteria bacterium]|nr:hypothetical protein [Alphaproteobacteria bacterium SS10]
MENFGSSGVGAMLNKITGGTAGDLGVLAAVGAGVVAAKKVGDAAIRETDPNGLSMAERNQHTLDTARWRANNGLGNQVPAEQQIPMASAPPPDAEDYYRAGPPGQKGGPPPVSRPSPF